ncbi:MAG: DNRLRE domain-containing protein [Verrucomicrobiota bacterium]
MKRVICLWLAAATAVFSLGDSHSAHGETIQLKASADTTLFQHDPDNNFGAVNSLSAGGTAGGPLARSLIKFDVGGNLPAAAKIISAQLKFEIVKVPTSGGRPSDFRLQRMLQDWTEGSGTGGPRGAAAAAGESTWNFRTHPTVRWSQPGGAAPADYLPSVSASVRVAGIGIYQFASTPELIVDVQAWLANPASNFGWMMLSQAERTPETARRIGAREAGERGPVLTIDYTIEPQLRIDRFEIVTNEFRFHFLAESNRAYVAETREAFAVGQWNSLTNFAPFLISTNVIVSDATNRPQRFYRLRSP